MQTRTPLSFRQVLSKLFHCATSVFSTLPNIRYAMSFSYQGAPVDTSLVTPNWLVNLTPDAIAGAVANGLGTLAVSSMFSARFIGIATDRMKSEYKICMQHKKRFAYEIFSGITSGIIGLMIASNSSEGAFKYVFMVTGFTVSASLSFLGSYGLASRWDENTIAKNNITFLLNRAHRMPEYKAQLNNFLHEKTVTPETCAAFLQHLPTIVQSCQEAGLPLSMQKTRLEKFIYLSDQFISLFLTTCVSSVYIEGGFAGTNIIVGGSLNSAPKIVQALIGTLLGSASILFIFFTLKIFEGPLARIVSEMKLDAKTIEKSVTLCLLNGLNATWFHSLARVLAQKTTVSPLLLSSYFAETIFPWTGFATCFILGVNGLAPLFFPAKLNTAEPTVKDMIHMIHTSEQPELREGTLSAWKKISFFQQQTATRERQALTAITTTQPPDPSAAEEILELTGLRFG